MNKAGRPLGVVSENIRRKVSKKRWDKYVLVSKKRDKKPLVRKDLFEYMAMDLSFVYENEEPVKCKEFGCGRTLSRNERLYSDRCVSHQSPSPFISHIDSHISA